LGVAAPLLLLLLLFQVQWALSPALATMATPCRRALPPPFGRNKMDQFMFYLCAAVCIKPHTTSGMVKKRKNTHATNCLQVV
jgi:hypothetical protein